MVAEPSPEMAVDVGSELTADHFSTPWELRHSLDSLLRRHQDELHGCVENWFAKQEASSEQHNSAVHAEGEEVQQQHIHETTLQRRPSSADGCAIALDGWDQPKQPNIDWVEQELLCNGRKKSSCRPASSAGVETAKQAHALPNARSASTDCLPIRVGKETIASTRGFTVKSLSSSEQEKQQERRTTGALQLQVNNILLPCKSQRSIDSDGSRAKSEVSHISSLQLETPVRVNRFSRSKSKADQPAKHKKWQHLTRGRKGFKTNRHATPLAKKKVQRMLETQSGLQRLTTSALYEHLEAAAILLNALFVCCETERRAALVAADALSDTVMQGEAGLNVVGDLFCILFVVDLALRLLADRLAFFCNPRERLWNVFDIIVVFTSILESIARWHQYATLRLSPFRIFAGKFCFLRMVRVLRIIRSTRAIRMNRHFWELNIMVHSLTGAVKPLLWSAVLLITFLLIFAVFIVDGAVAYLAQEGSAAPGFETLTTFFASLPEASMSLYQSMSGGVDWGEVWEALAVMDPLYRFSFLSFVSFAILALLNVVTAVFVETAVQRSMSDREMRVQKEMDNKVEFAQSMQRVFEELDTNNSGAITLEEFEKQMEDENVLTFMSTLELDVDQVWMLLCLLDRDQNGAVDLEEFITGCISLKGGAKSLDMAILKYQVEWMVYNMVYVTSTLGKLHNIWVPIGDSDDSDGST